MKNMTFRGVKHTVTTPSYVEGIKTPTPQDLHPWYQLPVWKKCSPSRVAPDSPIFGQRGQRSESYGPCFMLFQNLVRACLILSGMKQALTPLWNIGQFRLWSTPVQRDSIMEHWSVQTLIDPCSAWLHYGTLVSSDFDRPLFSVTPLWKMGQFRPWSTPVQRDSLTDKICSGHISNQCWQRDCGMWDCSSASPQQSSWLGFPRLVSGISSLLLTNVMRVRLQAGERELLEKSVNRKRYECRLKLV